MSGRHKLHDGTGVIASDEAGNKLIVVENLGACEEMDARERQALCREESREYRVQSFLVDSERARRAAHAYRSACDLFARVHANCS